MLRSVALLASVAAVALAAPAGWQREGRADPATPVALVVAIKHDNPKAIEEALLRVSDPQSPDFGKHLSKSDVDRLARPRPGGVAAVKAWVRAHGARDVRLSDARDFLLARATVATLEAMLGCEYYTFSRGDARVVRTECATAFPSFVADVVDFVSPSTRFPPAAALRVRAEGGAAAGQVTPAVIRSQYGINATEAKNAALQQAAAGFDGQWASTSDLAAFYSKFYTPAVGRTLNIVGQGPANQSTPGIEADLDVQYLSSIGGNVNTTYWYTAGQRPDENEPFLTWLLNIEQLSDAQLPKVYSVSYGDNENTVDIDYATRCNTEFAKVGARGVSLLVSSGDGGVAGSQSSPCPGGIFIPNYPAASPFVTAVGGTTGSAPETSAAFSSGGFSNYWARPSWQEAAVSTYLKTAKNLPSQKVFNATGAGFPDVAALGENFAIVYHGVSVAVDGTSCSAPTFAGVVSLLNDARLSAGKGSLGFLNQVFYAHPEVFTDVTTGSNPGCGTLGFPAAPGWDPVTGLGSPVFPKLLMLALALP